MIPQDAAKYRMQAHADINNLADRKSTQIQGLWIISVEGYGAIWKGFGPTFGGYSPSSACPHAGYTTFPKKIAQGSIEVPYGPLASHLLGSSPTSPATCSAFEVVKVKVQASCGYSPINSSLLCPEDEVTPLRRGPGLLVPLWPLQCSLCITLFFYTGFAFAIISHAVDSPVSQMSKTNNRNEPFGQVSTRVTTWLKLSTASGGGPLTHLKHPRA
ncbi:hypothetical protein K488DRAFT_71126 [Vararia minispora EC-137]|uniref:Uncharacterized protein n=1 Tax=Vararia minispora EC-137 TaxID=1314806 RepID=A0ACB8QJK8_9AGAM|nr:hypothetical protein K488DRAFT_71126 [Vararia minispora EC-137]